jgi:hypothetical protein
MHVLSHWPGRCGLLISNGTGIDWKLFANVFLQLLGLTKVCCEMHLFSFVYLCVCVCCFLGLQHMYWLLWYTIPLLSFFWFTFSSLV